jgi:hypothetical protein
MIRAAIRLEIEAAGGAGISITLESTVAATAQSKQRADRQAMSGCADLRARHQAPAAGGEAESPPAATVTPGAEATRPCTAAGDGYSTELSLHPVRPNSLHHRATLPELLPSGCAVGAK